MARSQFLRGWIQPTMPSTGADSPTPSCARASALGGRDIASTGRGTLNRRPRRGTASSVVSSCCSWKTTARLSRLHAVSAHQLRENQRRDG